MAAWAAIALVGSYELLMMVIRSSQVSARDTSDRKHETDPLREQAAEVFAEQLAADQVPSYAGLTWTTAGWALTQHGCRQVGEVAMLR